MAIREIAGKGGAMLYQYFATLNPDLVKSERLERAICDLIEKGIYKDGDPLPPQREIAERLDIALTVVTRVFNKLKKNGVLYGERGRGSFVAFRSQFAHDYGDRFSLDEDWLDQPPGQDQPASLILCNLVERLSFMNEPLPGQIDLGSLQKNVSHLKELGAAYLADYGLRLRASDVTVSHNAYLAFWTAFQICCQPGAVIGAPELSFLPIFRKKLVADNVGLVPLESDAYGILPEALENACLANGLTCVACSPECELPTTNRMHLRRQRIAELARRYNLTILENYWLMPGFDASLPPLTSLAPERTIFLEHGSKMLSCGEICSFSNIPSEWREKFIYQRNIIAGPLNLLTRKITAFWLEQGLAKADFERKNAEVARRNNLAAEILAGMTVRIHKFARYCWLGLEKGQSSTKLRENLQKQAVLVSAAPNYLVGSLCHSDGMLIGLGHEPSIERLEFALRLIRQQVLSKEVY